MFKINKRSVVDITTKYIPQSRELRNFFVYKSLKTYNLIPSSIKGMKKSKYKTEVKTFLKTKQVSDTYD